MVGTPFADLVGLWLALLLPALVAVGPLRRHKSVARAYLFTVALHIVAAAMYYYVPGVLPGRADSHAFSNVAARWQLMLEWPPFGVGAQAFRYYLAYVYSLFGPSFFLGSVLSVYAFAFSVVALAKLMELLGIQRGRGLIVLLFGGLPSAVLFGTVPMREAYQVLFFILACYWVLRFRLTHQPLHLVSAMAFALLMGLLHKGLVLFAPFVITVMLFMRVDQSPSRLGIRGVWLHRFAAVALAIGFVAAMSSSAVREDVEGIDLLTAATDGGLIDYATEFRMGVGDVPDGFTSAGRTTYGITLNSSSLFHLVYSSLIIFLYYLFTPFPWQIENYLDVYAFGEVILRIVFLWSIFQMWRSRKPIHPQIVTLFMVVYISAAFLWAAGTVNYGTAIRHHMVHQWILLLLGVPALMRTAPGVMHSHIGAQASGVRKSWPQRAMRPGLRSPDLRPLVGTSQRLARLEAGPRRARRLQGESGTPPTLSGGPG